MLLVITPGSLRYAKCRQRRSFGAQDARPQPDCPQARHCRALVLRLAESTFRADENGQFAPRHINSRQVFNSVRPQNQLQVIRAGVIPEPVKQRLRCVDRWHDISPTLFARTLRNFLPVFAAFRGTVRLKFDDREIR